MKPFPISGANARSILYSFHDFMERHTGDIPDDGEALFCINTAGVLMNNLHFEVGTTWYTPNGCATTEGQALLILGYYWMYKATNNKLFLERAIYYWDAYIEYFYAGQPIPSTPQIWRSNWLVNAKQPFQAFGPPNPNDPSNPGARDVVVTFTAGRGRLPTGMPWQGEKVVRLYSVYSGSLSYDSVRAAPTAPGFKYVIDWYVAHDGQKYDGAGRPIANPDNDLPGTIQLETLLNGEAKTAFATITGAMIGRNEVFDVWPVWRSLTLDDMGNSIDSEQWFAECCWLLFTETKQRRYLDAWRSCSYTAADATQLEAEKYYFRKDLKATSAFTDGISYEYFDTIDATYAIDRNPAGYIRIVRTAESDPTKVASMTLSQIAVYNRIKPTTEMWNDIGVSTLTSKLNFLMAVKSDLRGAAKEYRYPAKPKTTGIELYKVQLGKMVTVAESNGQEHVMLDGASFVEYGAATFNTVWRDNILGNRSDYMGQVIVPNNSSGVVIGFWLHTPNSRALTSLTYQTIAGTMWLKVTDADGWKWWRQLPESLTGHTLALNWADFSIVPGQDGTPPATPNPNQAMTQIELLTNGGAASLYTYCYGEVPAFFNDTTEPYSTEWSIEIQETAAQTILIGDVIIQNPAPLGLPYTPGVLPFSTKYSVSKARKDYWRGSPYLGYQYAPLWALMGKTTFYENCIEFFYDAQEAHFAKLGIMGPVPPTYVWPRYDNLEEGEIGEFTWGADALDNHDYPWGGYNTRCFQAACRLWRILVDQGKPVNPKLVTFCERYASYLADFQDQWDDLTPTQFPPDAPPFNDGAPSNPDHTAHMTGLILAGCAEMKFAGSKSTYVDRCMAGCLRELHRTMVVLQPDDNDHMNGSFSAWAGGNYFYGFWFGEVARGLSLYSMWVEQEQKAWQRRTQAETTITLEVNTNRTLVLPDGNALFISNPVTDTMEY